MVISELNPIAKAVMELVGLVSSRFQEFIDRNESVVQLLEEVGKAGVLVEDWDDPVLDDFRPNQRNVCKQLLPEIYQCFYLLWALSSDQSLVKRVSDRSIEVIHTHRKQLAALVERLKSNQHLDTQTAVFKTSVQVNDLHNDNCINRLHCAKNVGPSASKACLPDTRVALLSRIRAWALHPTSSRTLLLHGAAGKGKSATVHTVARELQSEGLAVVPFFAFNRSMPDRSSSQLIPTWAKHLAEWNSGYLLYLHTLLPHQLESSDILDQLDALLLRGLDSEINSGKPLILILDAVDECPREEANQLFRVLRKLLGGSNLPPFVRFVFTYRPDKEILQTFEGPDTLDISIDDEEGTSEDIRKFVHAQLDHTDTVHMVDDVTNAAQTLFECAAVLCRELTATRRPASASARREFIRKLRTGPVMSLYGSYTAILQMYFYNTDSELVKLFRRVMSWVLLVRSPQSLLVFRAFADTLLPTEEQPDVEMILCWLGGHSYLPTHTSLWDLPLDPDQSGTFSVDLGPSSQHELSLACLRIMNKGLSFNICGLLDSTVFALNSEVKDLPERVKKCISPGLQYACLATAHHLWSAEPGFHTPLDIVEEAKTFFHHSFLFWLEAHSCMQTGQDGPGTILAVFLKWAMIVAEKELETTVLDYIRFEKRFREGYMLSAPQIYMSGLTFAPRNSIVSHHYGPKFRNFIEASGAVDIEWPPSETLVIQAVSRILSVAFSLDGTRIASGGVDHTIRVWDAATGQQLGEALVGHTQYIVSGSDDKTIRVWDVATGQQPGKALTRHSHRIRSVAFSPNGTQILSGGDDKTLRLWDAVTGKQCGEALTGHTEPVYSVAFSLDGTRIISGSLDSTIQVWDAVTGKKCDEALTGHTRGVCSVAFSLDGSWIASGSRDHSIRVWDTVTRQQLGRALKGHTEWVRAVAFSPNGNLIASGGDDKNVRLWDAVAGKQRGESLRGHTGLVYSVAFSPDGTRIVSGSLDSTIRLWDAMTGKQCGKALTGHTGGVCSVAFSLDGAWIASGSWDHSIRLWNAVTGKQYGEPLTGHRACIYSVAFSPDGTRIVSGGEDKTIRIWDSATAQVGRTPMGHTASVSSVVFSPDSTQNIVLESKGKGIQVLGAAQEGMVQFGDAWFYRTKDQEKSYTLWIPHPFRHCSFVWYPTTTVISPQPQISLQFLEDFCSYVGKES
ncbi:quinon protein alcohol dehydrogenase-like superfamily [Mycena olivaceomarginata]|nr:quinon protein alcohol dehydrogenase-like superfamily [Mycena olivaceomarginata]